MEAFLDQHDHLQDTEFLRGLERALEASAVSGTLPLEPAGIAIATLRNSIWARETVCDCTLLEDSDSDMEADSDPEDDSYCGLLDLKEGEYLFPKVNMATTLQAVLEKLEHWIALLPQSFVERARARLEVEESKGRRSPKPARQPSPLPSISLSPDEDSNSTVQFALPLQGIPAELIFEIIALVQPFDPHVHITLSHLSRFFRSLINSSPILWTKIDFFYPLPLISLYVERSADALLDVTADGGHHVDTQSWRRQERTSAGLAILRPHRHRIRRLRVRDVDALFWGLDRRDMTRVPQPRPDPTDNFLWSSELCNLEVLDLDFLEWSGHDRVVLPPVANLRKLRLCGPWPWPNWALFSSQLRSIALGDCSVRLPLLLEVLRCLPALVELGLSDFYFSDITVCPKAPPLVLEHLKDLSLIRCSISTVQTTLKKLSIPGLPALTIHFREEGLDTIPSTVDVTGVQLFSQVPPNINKLDLTGFHSDWDFIEAMLQKLPALTHLRIASASLRDNHLLLLTTEDYRDLSGRPFCPQLNSLTIENEFDISSRMIRLIASSRHSASIPLTTLVLRGLDGTKVTADDIESLSTYGVTELVVDVVYPTFCGESAEESEMESEGEDSSEGEWFSGDEEAVPAVLARRV
ncbi:hypothetical protein FRC04_001710 [Tulasnella sp. 424]|nr:hypothetical protein FRC04_001710 [Tulasnella sp. 424]KAG8975444.1 hypothetical protein FRC05_005774 [Tulasnella sp. 425]